MNCQHNFRCILCVKGYHNYKHNIQCNICGEKFESDSQKSISETPKKQNSDTFASLIAELDLYREDTYQDGFIEGVQKAQKMVEDAINKSLNTPTPYTDGLEKPFNFSKCNDVNLFVYVLKKELFGNA